MLRINSLLLLFLLLYSSAFAEGTKELNANGMLSTGLSICTDISYHCIGANGTRSNFAAYGSMEADRLYFTVAGYNEVVFMGFKGETLSSNPPRQIVFQVRDYTGFIVLPEQILPSSGTGYIYNFAQALSGPNQLIPSPGPYTGYDALVFTPPGPGNYYIEFALRTYGSNQLYPGTFKIDLFDITVGDPVNMIAKPGRLYSKSWQFSEVMRFYGTNYVMTDDGIIFSAAFSNMQSAIWSQNCNQFGCNNSGNWLFDRKSVYHQQSGLPQYKIFLNNPDPVVFPPVSSLGQIISPYPWGEENCNTGQITFHITVDKPGMIELLLNFSNGYQPRTVVQTVTIGENTVIWDGMDGSGLPVSNNTSVTFSAQFMNGLTNMPLCDVERNPAGFTISLVSPAGLQPATYWDDTNIPGGASNSIPPGCISPPGCHVWTGTGNGWGDLNTLNTWWYLPSSATIPSQITEFRVPRQMVLQQTPPYNYCLNTAGNVFSVVPDPNTEEYHWSYNPPDGVTVTQTSPVNPEVTLTFGPGATSGTLAVYGTNLNCSDPGPALQVPIALSSGLPAESAAISGDTTVIPGLAGVSYFVEPILNATGYLWNLPLEATIVSGENTNHIVVNFGENAVSGAITVNGVNGCGSGPVSSELFVHVIPCAAFAVFSTDALLCTSNPVHFLRELTPENIIQEVWNFGDGQSETFTCPPSLPENITHIYASAGIFSVTRTVTFTTNHTESFNLIIEVNTAPVADFYIFGDPTFLNPVTCASQLVYFMDTSYPGSSVPGNSIVSWIWDFGDNSPLFYGAVNVMHVYNEPGSYLVTLTVTNFGGCTHSVTKTATLISIPAEPEFIDGPSDLCTGSTAIQYRVNPVPDAGSYNWSLPPGAMVASGGGTNSILVDFPDYPVSGIMQVQPVNSCGEGPQSSPLIVKTHAQLTGLATLINLVIPSGLIECHAAQVITTAGGGATFSIENGGKETLIAGEKILLLDGTTVESGGYLHAIATNFCIPCDTSATLKTIHHQETADGETTVTGNSTMGLQFKIYPIPTRGCFTLELSNDPKNEPVFIKIFDILGSTVLEKEIHSGRTHDISLENQVPGVYLLTLMKQNFIGTCKVIRN